MGNIKKKIELKPPKLKPLGKLSKKPIDKPGGTCKQGERADLTGCIPANGEGVGANINPVTEELKITATPPKVEELGIEEVKPEEVPPFDFSQQDPDHPLAQAIRQDVNSNKIVEDLANNTKVMKLKSSIKANKENADRFWKAGSINSDINKKAALYNKSKEFGDAAKRQANELKGLEEKARQQLIDLLRTKEPIKINFVKDDIGVMEEISEEQLSSVKQAQSFVESITHNGGSGKHSIRLGSSVSGRAY